MHLQKSIQSCNLAPLRHAHSPPPTTVPPAHRTRDAHVVAAKARQARLRAASGLDSQPKHLLEPVLVIQMPRRNASVAQPRGWAADQRVSDPLLITPGGGWMAFRVCMRSLRGTDERACPTCGRMHETVIIVGAIDGGGFGDRRGQSLSEFCPISPSGQPQHARG